MTPLRKRWAAVFALLLALGGPGRVHGSTVPANFQDQLVMGDLFEPVGMAFLPDGRLLVIERTGRVRFVVDGKLGAVDPILEPDSVFSGSLECGLLGIAVDARWPAQPYVYLDHTTPDGSIEVVRYRAGGDLDDATSVLLTIDPLTRYIVLRIPNQSLFHNGGTLRFGPDGMLYVSLGDDEDPCSAQDSTRLRGALLRIKVNALPDSAGGPPDRSLLVPPGNPWASSPAVDARLAWAIGLRNPFRFHIDPRDGGVFVGDVGEGQYEEIDWIRSPGENLGWPFFEGPAARVTSCEDPGPPAPLGPIQSYSDRSNDQLAAVVSGGIYLGSGCATCRFPAEYEGDYFFADFYVGFIRRLKLTQGTWSPASPVAGQPSAVDWGEGFQTLADMAVGLDGALWYCAKGAGAADGELRRIAFVAPQAAVSENRNDRVSFAPPSPSPARERVLLAYRLPRGAQVDLEVFDAAGRRVRSLVAGALQDAGRHAVSWDGRLEGGREAPSGMYLARLRVDGAGYLRRLAIVR